MSNPVTPQMVKQLRDRTDQPMGLCKQALDQNGGDMEKAVDWLRAQNKNMGVKREGNETAEGRIGVYFDNAAKKAAIVEMRCESAPSAKSDQFIALANDLAKHVARQNPKDVAEALTQSVPGRSGTVQDRINDVIGVIREKMILQRFQRLEGGLRQVQSLGSVPAGCALEGEPGVVSARQAWHRAGILPPAALRADSRS